MGPLLFLVGIFFLNFLSRIILSPLMPTVEGDLKIGHDEAGALFLLISLGYCLGLLASGFVSSRFQHRRTILFSSISVGGALMIVSFSHNLWGIRFGLILVGITAGLYLPSGIATVTELVRPEHWGKAIAIHELAPNLSFFLAPLLAEALLGLSSWREVVMFTGIASMAAGAVFAFLGRGGAFPGETPNLRILKTILSQRSFWIMIALFSLAVGASFGVYTMMPLYLVAEKGMERPWANTLVGLSRVSTLGSSFLSGWVTDRIGPKRTLWGVFMTTGIVTLLLGLVSGSWIILTVFLQPMAATAFFPPGFAALSKMGSQRIKNVAVSLTMPVGFLVGGGVIAGGIGIMGKMGSFPLGISLFGAVLFLGVLLVRYLKFSNE